MAPDSYVEKVTAEETPCESKFVREPCANYGIQFLFNQKFTADIPFIHSHRE